MNVIALFVLYSSQEPAILTDVTEVSVGLGYERMSEEVDAVAEVKGGACTWGVEEGDEKSGVWEGADGGDSR